MGSTTTTSTSPQISDAEWEVMKAVWDAQPVPASDVVERLRREQGWAPRTVKTMLNRLVGKGALAYEVDGKRFLYRATVNRDACVRHESRSFLARVFGGNSAAMLAHLVKHTRLSPKEVEELKRILAGKEKGQ